MTLAQTERESERSKKMTCPTFMSQLYFLSLLRIDFQFVTIRRDVSFRTSESFGSLLFRSIRRLQETWTNAIALCYHCCFTFLFAHVIFLHSMQISNRHRFKRLCLIFIVWIFQWNSWIVALLFEYSNLLLAIQQVSKSTSTLNEEREKKTRNNQIWVHTMAIRSSSDANEL